MSDEMVQIAVEIPLEVITTALEEAGFATSDDNINAMAEGLGNKWMTDVTELNDMDFLVEVVADDLEPDENNYKAHRDWRMRQGE